VSHDGEQRLAAPVLRETQARDHHHRLLRVAEVY